MKYPLVLLVSLVAIAFANKKPEEKKANAKADVPKQCRLHTQLLSVEAKTNKCDKFIFFSSHCKFRVRVVAEETKPLKDNKTKDDKKKKGDKKKKHPKGHRPDGKQFNLEKFFQKKSKAMKCDAKEEAAAKSKHNECKHQYAFRGVPHLVKFHLYEVDTFIDDTVIEQQIKLPKEFVEDPHKSATAKKFETVDLKSKGKVEGGEVHAKLQFWITCPEK